MLKLKIVVNRMISVSLPYMYNQVVDLCKMVDNNLMSNSTVNPRMHLSEMPDNAFLYSSEKLDYCYNTYTESLIIKNK